MELYCIIMYRFYLLSRELGSMVTGLRAERLGAQFLAPPGDWATC